VVGGVEVRKAVYSAGKLAYRLAVDAPGECPKELSDCVNLVCYMRQ
jgi:hypothetical protein